jgi:cell division protein ZipA
MTELRVALFLISAGFLAGLTWWEWRRPRQAHAGRGERARRTLREAEVAPPAPARSVTESTLVLPEIRAHEPLGRHALPVVELRPDAADESRLARADPELPGAPPEPPAVPSAPAVDESTHAAVTTPAELDAGRSFDAGHDLDADRDPDAEDELEAESELEADSEHTPMAGDLAAPAAAPCEELPRLPPSPSPVVEWPPDEERRIVSLRLVAISPERFVGRSLRQALAAEGFVLGRFAIFHKPDEARRAVLSAASLNRPGTFDADTMDSQHYGGLSLFAVLPGPKPPPQAFDELVFTARSLNERLQGVLQDEQGGPLTPSRIATLRERLNTGTAL